MAPAPSIRLGLIGKNIERSKAPLLHVLAGQLCGLDIRYDRLVPAEMDCSFEAVFAQCRAEGYRGVNITHPYKESVVPLIRVDDPRVAAIGACNTVLFGADGTRGFNTDYSGFAATFRAAFPGATPGVVAVAGAGGVGKAIGFALTDLGATALQIFDENRSKAEDLKDALVGIAPDMTVSVAATIEDAAAGADGLVNCTPLGMVGYSGTAFPKPLMRSQRWAFDAVYTPVDTQFMMDARDHGLETVSGYELFFHQGVEAFQIFTGRNVVPIALRAKLTES